MCCPRDEIFVGNRQAAVINLRHNSRRTIQDTSFQVLCASFVRELHAAKVHWGPQIGRSVSGDSKSSV